jgi:hypothetical protein
MIYSYLYLILKQELFLSNFSSVLTCGAHLSVGCSSIATPMPTRPACVSSVSVSHSTAAPPPARHPSDAHQSSLHFIHRELNPLIIASLQRARRQIENKSEKRTETRKKTRENTRSIEVSIRIENEDDQPGYTCTRRRTPRPTSVIHIPQDLNASALHPQ